MSEIYLLFKSSNIMRMYRNEFEITLKAANLDRLFDILSNPMNFIKKLISIKEIFQISINEYKAKVSNIANLEIVIDRELIKTTRSFMLRYLIKREAFPKLFCKIEIYGIVKGEDVSLKFVYERENSMLNFIYDLREINEENIKNILNQN